MQINASATSASGLEPTAPERRRFGPADDLAVLAHEVRGALLAARAVVERLQLGEGSGNREEVLERARVELEDITLAADRLLEWAAGSPPRFRATNLELLADEVARRCILASGEDRVRVFCSGELTAIVDERSIEVGLGNLIRNALAYSPPGSPVHVTLSRARGDAVLSVSNVGPGVPAELRNAIFRPLVRRPGGRGRGLGLYLAAQTAGVHDGTIDLDERGGTTTFRLTIPLALRRGTSFAS